ncbi:FRG domain-containing protein [Hydrogenimonas sp.]
MSVFQHIHFKNPQDLISFFELEKVKGMNNQRKWIFRGQAQEDWGLHSKLAREIIDNKNLKNILSSFYWEENVILTSFLHACREIGLELPLPPKNYKNMSFLEFEQNQHLMALGQHYGLPTRMLDWTLNWRNALFFALDPIKQNYSKDSNLVIWCLDRQYTDLGLRYMIDGHSYMINEYWPSFHQNKNAVAQAGVFTYIESPFDTRSDEFFFNKLVKQENVSINHLDINYALANGEILNYGENKKITIGYKLTISRMHFEYLLQWLDSRFINQHYLFPDYQGVCISILNDWRNEVNKGSI